MTGGYEHINFDYKVIFKQKMVSHFYGYQENNFG